MMMTAIITRTTIVVMMMLLFVLNSSLPVSSEEDNGLSDSMNRELVSKNRRPLGECEGNCDQKRKCGGDLKCARFNQKTLIKAGFDGRSAYCLNRNEDNKYYCYDPQVLKDWTACPADFFDNPKACNRNSPWFDETCLQHIDEEFQCGRAPVEFINATHAICAKFQRCYSYANCGCDTEGFPYCVSSTVSFPYVCVN